MNGLITQHTATTFMPGYAKAVYEHFGAQAVLDPCAGWGDRMLGATRPYTYLPAPPSSPYPLHRRSHGQRLCAALRRF